MTEFVDISELISLGDPSLCNLACTGEENTKCGGPGFFSVYDAVSNTPKFVTFDVSQSATDVKIENINVDGVNVYLYYQIGTGSYPVLVKDLPHSSYPDPILVPLDSLIAGETLVTSKYFFYFL